MAFEKTKKQSLQWPWPLAKVRLFFLTSFSAGIIIHDNTLFIYSSGQANMHYNTNLTLARYDNQLRSKIPNHISRPTMLLF